MLEQAKIPPDSRRGPHIGRNQKTQRKAVAAQRRRPPSPKVRDEIKIK